MGAPSALSRLTVGLVPGVAALALACGSTGGLPDLQPAVEPESSPEQPPTPPIDPAHPGGSASGAAAASGDTGSAPAGGDDSQAAAEAAPDRASGPVAFVEGRPVEIDELVSSWWQWDSLRAKDHLERLVDRRLVEAEAARLGVAVPEALVAERTREALDAVRAVVAEGGSGLTLDQYLRRVLDMDPVAYARRVKEDTREQLYRERAVRGWLLSSERAEVRILVTADESAMKRAQEELAAGKPFADVARLHSIDGSATSGGRVPPLVKSEHSPLARQAFSTPVGETTGPIPEPAEGSARWIDVLVERRPEPLAPRWAALADAVEGSLRDEPVGDPEYLQWKVTMERLYLVDRSPFRRLVGEPDAE